MCAMVKSRYIGDGHPTFNRNPYNGYINPYYWVDDHPLLYGNHGSLDPGTCNQPSLNKCMPSPSNGWCEKTLRGCLMAPCPIHFDTPWRVQVEKH